MDLGKLNFRIVFSNVLIISILLFIVYILYIYYIYYFSPSSREKFNSSSPSHSLISPTSVLPVQVYVISWKKVSENALKILNEVSSAFDNTIFIDCDETSSFSKPGIKIIRLTDDAYYGKQFQTIINDSFGNNCITGIIVGDIKPGFTDWNQVRNNMLSCFTEIDVGIYAPLDTRTRVNSMGVLDLSSPLSSLSLQNGYINYTEYTDCTAWFLSPVLVSLCKQIDIPSITHYGWGIDSFLCEYTNYIGYKAVYDTSVQVSNPMGCGYDSSKAYIDINSVKEYAIANGIIPKDIQRSLIHLITFANSDGDFAKSQIQLISEALSMGVFDIVKGFNEKSPELADFFNDIGIRNFIASNKRGYGYWCWKFYFILEYLKSVAINDIVVYTDSGCTFNANGINRFKEYIELAKINDLVVFQITSHPEYVWTKGDVITGLGCSNNEMCYNTDQIMSGVFIMKNCPRILKFFEKLLTLSMTSGYNLLTDSESAVKNFEGFKEHRHDQSLFSIMVKILMSSNVSVVQSFEIDNSVDSIYPILATRRRL